MILKYENKYQKRGSGHPCLAQWDKTNSEVKLSFMNKQMETRMPESLHANTGPTMILW